jgi:peptide/nickel transport system permease protein
MARDEAASLAASKDAGGARDRQSLWLRTLIAIVKNPMGATGLALVLVLVIGGLAAPLLAPHDPLYQFRGYELQTPSLRFWFGTDQFGRDLLSRVLFGLRASLFVSLFAVGVGGVLGVVAGFIAGFSGGIVDTVIMRIVDTLLAFPGLILAIGILAAFGVGLQSVAIALGIGAWPRFARLARGQMLTERPRDYVLAARALGASDARIIFRHISLNAMPPLLVQAALSMAGAVVAEAALDFLGIGTVAPAASLGSLINDGRSQLDHPYLLIFPAIALGLYLLGLNLLADATNDALDPHRPRR